MSASEPVRATLTELPTTFKNSLQGLVFTLSLLFRLALYSVFKSVASHQISYYHCQVLELISVGSYGV